jgi:hypothetical protein
MARARGRWSRIRAQWRWAVVAGVVAGLIAVPVVSASWPVTDPGVDTATLVERIADSDETAYVGLFASRGGLRLPDLGRYDDEVAPFATTSRVRVWYAAPDSWRADELLIGAERSVRREPGRVVTWDSGTRRARTAPRPDLAEGTEPLRIPRLMDLAPAELGRRMVRELRDDPDVVVERVAPRRVAGVDASGIAFRPADPSASQSTIDAVEVWADASTGVVVAVEIETGGVAPAFETAWVELDLLPDGIVPAREVLRFDPEAAGVPFIVDATIDPIETVSGFSIGTYPDTLAGLPRRTGGAAGVATYGDGLALVTVVALPPGALGRPGRGVYALPTSSRPWGGEARVLSTSLVNAQLTTSDGLDVLVAGTVTTAELDRIVGELVGDGVFP